MWDKQVASVEVFSGTQSPAHPVKIYSVKVILDLQKKKNPRETLWNWEMQKQQGDAKQQ